MSNNNDNFFHEKKLWSKVKDELLKCYLKPYVQKILCTHKPFVYIDCFAGKGKFDDGSDGSPLIALHIIKQCLKDTKVLSLPQVQTNFIEMKYAKDLKENLLDYSDANIVSGRYDEKILDLLLNKQNCNIFLYIDPYGIKALKYSLFDSLSKQSFNTIELLINFNSFGFIREACHAMGSEFKIDDQTLFDDLVESDPTIFAENDKSIRALNDIAGGEYWQDIIMDFKAKHINGYEAEEEFAKLYCQRLANNFKFVLNMPIRKKRGQHPKYRMVHATNHPDGCLLMVDNICNRWDAWREVQNGGQLTLLPENVHEQLVDDDYVNEKIIEHYSKLNRFTLLSISLAQFFMRYGPVRKPNYIKEVLKKMEDENRIQVKREPATTKSGKPSKFMEEKTGKKKVLLRWLK